MQDTSTNNVFLGRLWSLGVLITCFIVMALSSGAASSMSILMVEFLDYFRESKFVTSWCGSLPLALNATTALIWMAAQRRLSHRCLLIFGIVLTSLGQFGAAFATRVYDLHITLGIIAGFGYGAMDYVSMVFTAEYFDDHKFLAMGFVSAGSGAGSVVLPFFLNYLINTSAWRGALVILSALTAQCTLLVLLFTRKTTCSKITPTTNSYNPYNIELIVDKNESETLKFKDTEDRNNVDHVDKQIAEAKPIFTIEKPKSSIPSEIAPTMQTYNPHSVEVIIDRKESERLEFTNDEHKTTVHHVEGQISNAEPDVTIDKTKIRSPSLKDNLVHLLTTWRFHCLWINVFLTMLCSALFFTFNMAYFLSVGISHGDGVVLLLCVGIGSVCGRLFAGISSHFFARRVPFLLLLSAMLVAISSILMAKLTHFGLYTILSFAFGSAFGCLATTSTIIPSTQFGPQFIREGLALNMLAGGSGLLIGPPLGGLVFDLTQNYRAVLMTSMGISLVSATVVLPVVCLSRSRIPNG